MIPVDQMISIPYCLFAMLKSSSCRYQVNTTVVGAVILVFLLPLCLLSGGMGSQDSCWDLGPVPGLCGKAVGQVDHLVAAPASLLTLPSYRETSEVFFQHFAPAIPSLGLLSISDGRAPPHA